MRFGVLILFFYSERTILQCIANCAPHVDQIYISYSRVPWTKYNQNARHEYTNTADISLLHSSPHIDKIKIIKGVWESDEDQRNAALNQAKQDGIDIFIIQDADEFYLPSEFQKNIQAIKENLSYPFYYNPWMNFWKRPDQVLLERKNIVGSRFSLYSVSSNFAMNLKMFPDIYFQNCRRPNYSHDRGLRLPGVCFHLSYVHDDEYMQKKVSTWGHSHQVPEKWMKYKWYGWTPDSKFLHPLSGPIWQKVIKYNGELPKELQDFPAVNHAHIPLTAEEKFLEKQYDREQLRQYYYTQTKGWLAKKLKLGEYKRNRSGK